MQPDRVTIYLALAVVAGAIAAVTGPSLALLTLAQIVVVVELVNCIAAPGDLKCSVLPPEHSKGE
jgi:hypothetical protein